MLLSLSSSKRLELKGSRSLSFLWVCVKHLSLYSQLICKIGYYNPLLAYGEDKAIQNAAKAGANGFIMVDLPPEEALTFREKCRKAEWV
jgi:tryptophan synthase alpha subunit